MHSSNAPVRRNVYDAKGRHIASMTETSAGDEITKTTTAYNADDQATGVTNYERRDGATGASLDASNAILTYTHRWYDTGGRLEMSADYGTNSFGGDYTTNSFFPAPTYGDIEDYPYWTNPAIVRYHEYDEAGHEVRVADNFFSGDEQVGATEYDGLDRVILTIENADAADPADRRLTAYYYECAEADPEVKCNSGRLLKMAAVLPGHAGGNVQKWEDIDWAASDGTLQVTEFVYGADVVGSYWDPEAGTGGERVTGVISAHNGWIKEVHYPDEATGQPDVNAALSFTYYADGAVASRTDAEGRTFHYVYDERGRLAEVGVEVDAYHAATNPVRRIEYGYTPDGLLAEVKAFDAETGGTLLYHNVLTYDDRRNLASEAQSHDGLVDGSTPTVGYVWDYSPVSAYNFDRLGSITYPVLPEGGSPRTLTFHYGNDQDDIDSTMNRVTEIHDSVLDLNVAEYAYMGHGRRVGMTLGNGITQSFNAVGSPYGYPELDQWGRVKDLHYKDGSSATVHRYQHAHDKHGNRLFARVTQAEEPGVPATPHDNDRSWRYAYDGLNRLTGADYGQLTANNSAIEDEYANRSTWQLDNLGNWSGGASDDSFTSSIDTDGNGVADNTFTLHHDVDLTNAIDTLVANSSPMQFINDRAGNMVFDGTFVYRYDAWNRLVAIHELGMATIDENGHIGDPGDLGATLVATLRYGPLGRLITYENDTLTEHYYYDGVRRIQTIEDDTVDLTTQAEYVYSPDYVDEFILQTRNTGGGTFQTMYMLQDANFNVVALTDGSGNVLEQYAWEPYGTQAAMDTLGTPAPDNRVGHQGLFYYAFGNTGLYYNRNRWYSPTLGRFTTKDPNSTNAVITKSEAMNGIRHGTNVNKMIPTAHYADGMSLYETGASNPLTYRDPMGLDYDPFAEADAVTGSLIVDYFGAYGAVLAAKDQIKRGNYLAMAYAAAAFAWDEVVWNEGEGALYSVALGGFFARACFEAGTPVMMADGTTRSIETIQVDDYVLCDSDPAADGLEECRVLQTMERRVEEILHLAVECDDRTAYINTTPEHPFYNTQCHRYLSASSLEIGDHLLTIDRRPAEVVGIQRSEQSRLVYNLEIEDAHNYFVGDHALLVHNACNTGPFPKKKAPKWLKENWIRETARQLFDQFGEDGAKFVRGIIEGQIDEAGEAVEKWSKFLDEVIGK